MLNTERYYLEELKRNNAGALTPYLEYFYRNVELEQQQSGGKRKKGGEINNSKMMLYEAKNIPELRAIGTSLFIFINTNIFQTQSADTESLKNYIRMIPQQITGQYGNIGFLHYFIVGHVPFVSVKKNTSDKVVIHPDPTVMDTIFNELSMYKPIYLCADTHNFQITTMNKQILQVVVGTGGADPDIMPDTYEMSRNKLKYDIHNKYDIEGFYQNSYGYSVITLDDNDHSWVSIEYKKLIEVDSKEDKSEKKYYKAANMDYIYKYSKNERGYEVQLIDKEELKGNLKIDHAKFIASDVCNNLSDDNLVRFENQENNPNKDKGPYCYQKKVSK